MLLPRGNLTKLFVVKVWIMAVWLCLLFLFHDSTTCVQAWTSSGTTQQHHRNQAHPSTKTAKRPSSSVQYAPTHMPTTETPDLVAQKMMQAASTTARQQQHSPHASTGGSSRDNTRKNQGFLLTRSAMASSSFDSSSSGAAFPTSHGLLSPETVRRMEELTIREGHKSEALVSFLKTYKQHGPMSCLPMLSDPDILPHLTNAMRESMA